MNLRDGTRLSLSSVCIINTGYTHSVRTNIVIDDRLMKDALCATGLKTKREVVEQALRTVVRLSRQAEIRQLRGKVDWQGDLDSMRTDK